jgi:hypothetical protein
VQIKQSSENPTPGYVACQYSLGSVTRNIPWDDIDDACNLLLSNTRTGVSNIYPLHQSAGQELVVHP